MTAITRVEVFQVDLKAKARRGDAIQSFPVQETPMVRIFADDGAEGTGYSYTIGTGGSSVVALIRDHLAPQLIGRDPQMVEQIWRDLFFHTHATAVGAITSLALCAIDTALWDLRCRRAGLPLHVMAGGAREKIPVYDTEGGWLHIPTALLVENAEEVRSRGFRGVKIKVGKPHVAEDMKRLRAVRRAIGDSLELMVDANQGFDVPEAIRRARHYEEVDLAWLEEPLPAEDLHGHVLLRESTTLPIAVGESLYSLSHFREYLQRGACTIVQTDVARIGGITPWLKCAHLAESFDVPICPHYLMELHVGLCAAVPNAPWVEYIPQLDVIMKNELKIEKGFAFPFDSPGLGIEWDWKAIEKLRVAPPAVVGGSKPPAARARAKEGSK
ncbi:MAG TPA: mandelate racemase/muconate lactonizing enzyme family protein [Burkholderiales bacterium]|jgi:L-alanine-DL-glutamate epimerase-like enolase superfamily enzyme|nr:mandelate racemase/muconate lactonizing enzyme family protein [Burkholderiales bacterium]